MCLSRRLATTDPAIPRLHSRIAATTDAYAVPSAEQLELASSLTVVSERGERILFGALWKEQKAIVIFLRHFLCPHSQDYMASIVRSLPLSVLHHSQINLVIISNGAFEMIRSYGKIFQTPFTIYTDPEHQVYEALGMARGSLESGPPGSYIRHGMLGGIRMVLVNAIKTRMPIWKNAGDISQLGGEFVLGPGISCSFAHRMRYKRDHWPILSVAAQSGLNLWTYLSEMEPQNSIEKMGEEEAWMKERKKILADLWHRKLLRRGGNHWCDDAYLVADDSESLTEVEDAQNSSTVCDFDGI